MKSKSLALTPETQIALNEAFEWMDKHSAPVIGGERVYEGRGLTKRVNQMLVAMSQAIIDFNPSVPGAFIFPLVFTARNETREEQENRILIEAMRMGAEVANGEIPQHGFH